MGAYVSRFGTNNQVLPKEGPKIFPYNLDFSTATSQEVDLTLQIQQEFISFIQGFYIDNRNNANTVFVQAETSNQVIAIPAGNQAYMPMFFTDDAKVLITTIAAANLVIPFYVTNVPVSPQIWGTVAGSGSSATVAAINAMSAKLPATLGAKTGAQSLSVVPNTDTPFPTRAGTLAAAAATNPAYQQVVNATLAASTPLTAPTNATIAVVQNNATTTSVRYRIDGATNAPTAALGQRIYPGQSLTFNLGVAGIAALRFIREASDTSLTLDVQYYV